MSIKRLDGVLTLLREHLPHQVESAGEFDDWNVAGPAFVAIAADLLESIASAIPPRGRVRAEILARSLAEYVIGFAWLAAADEDERLTRMREFVRDEFVEREKAENKLRDQIGQRPAYKMLFDSERVPPVLLDDRTRERLAELKADDSIRPLPNAFDMAFAADARWAPEIELVAHNPFALIYFTMFTGPSFMTHPSVSAIGRVVVGTPPRLVVGLPEPLGGSEGPYGQALLAFVNMCLVAARVLGWPDESRLMAILDETN